MVLTGPCLCRTQSVPYSSVLCVLLCYNNKGSLVFTTEVQEVKQLLQNRIYTLTTKWEFSNTLSLYFHCTLFLTFTVFTSWSGETKNIQAQECNNGAHLESRPVIPGTKLTFSFHSSQEWGQQHKAPAPHIFPCSYLLSVTYLKTT